MSQSLQQSSRREFIVGAAAAAAAMACPWTASPAPAAEFKSKIRKAMIIEKVDEKTLAPLKEAGFAGVESHDYLCSEQDAAKARKIAESLGMRIHSVMRGWADFNDSDSTKAEASLEETRKSLRAAHGYGADTILLVPCRVGKIAMPEAWEFDIEFDEKTLHVSRVVKGDNSKFAEYIAAQNRATDTSRAAVEKLIPLAEDAKIIIALENVWNNLWVRPDFHKALVASFASPWVKAYFDIGNHVKYGIPPQDWIKTLGSLIAKLHFKGFKLNPDGHGGKFVHLPEGSIDWPAVRNALEEIGYDGWGSIEEHGLPLAEFSRRFDQIIAGK